MIARYTRPEMAAIWSDERRLAIWLEIEIAVCEALATRGRVPAEAARVIRARASASRSSSWHPWCARSSSWSRRGRRRTRR